MVKDAELSDERGVAAVGGEISGETTSDDGAYLYERLLSPSGSSYYFHVLADTGGAVAASAAGCSLGDGGEGAERSAIYKYIASERPL